MLRKCLTFLSLVLVTLAAAADDKAAEPAQPEVQTLSIGPEAFGEYPAVLVSLKEYKLYKTDKNGDPSRDVMSPIDLFIEPRDPEIGSYLGNGKRAQIGLLEADFDRIERLPDGVAWLTAPRPMSLVKHPLLKSGFVFFVRSTLGNTYKVRIDELDPQAQTMKLSYARLLP